MTNSEREEIIFKAKGHPKNEVVFFICEHCLQSVKIRAVALSKKDGKLLLCKSCGVKYSKSLYTEDRIKEITDKRGRTCMSLYGVKAGGGRSSVEKSKNTFIEKHGSLDEAYSKRREKIEETLIERYGVNCPMKNKEIVESYRERMVEKFGSIREAYKERMHSIVATNMERYGVKSTFETDNMKSKSKITMIERYGVDHPLKSEDIKIKMLETRSIGKTFHGYLFDEIRFDSSYELAYYVYLKDHKVSFEYHPKNKVVSYVGEDGLSHIYSPDFIVDSELIEIKGGMFFDKDNNPINPYSKKSWKHKYDMMIDNKVRILREDDLIDVFDYVFKSKGDDFLLSCKLEES